jgi:hypothetical protein
MINGVPVAAPAEIDVTTAEQLRVIPALGCPRQ